MYPNPLFPMYYKEMPPPLNYFQKEKFIEINIVLFYVWNQTG